jgi:ATP-dependent exoDNAse (exonuclease V) beta subunit
MMRLFRARDEVGGTLATSWLATGGYAGAQRAVELALDRQVLMSADREPTGCVLMSIHKSKGKEFDGVILVEGAHAHMAANASWFCEESSNSGLIFNAEGCRVVDGGGL